MPTSRLLGIVFYLAHGFLFHVSGIWLPTRGEIPTTVRFGME